MSPVTSTSLRLDAQQIGRRLQAYCTTHPIGPETTGRLQKVAGPLLRATGANAVVGELCKLTNDRHEPLGLAEVVGFDSGVILMSPLGEIHGIGPHTRVAPTGQQLTVPVGDFALGRVFDGLGQAMLDEGPPIPAGVVRRPVFASAPAPLQRTAISRLLPVGIAAIDALLTLGIGQRLGVFAPAGCGKTSLMSMICRNADVDIVVAALVGERGREVGDFLQWTADANARHRTVVVAATSDRSPAERLKAAFVAMAHAEYFAGQGRSVLLLVDSVTRLARAARELGLAVGEPPTRRGYPPSVFSMLPRLFERAGPTQGGTITGIFTVLEETDDGMDPVSEEARSLLDGHVVLSRKLASEGHFPAIDVLQSASRLFDRVTPPHHRQAAARVRELLVKYEEVELLLRLGEYRRGNDALADEAIARHAEIMQFLRQAPQEQQTMEAMLERLMRFSGAVAR